VITQKASGDSTLGSGLRAVVFAGLFRRRAQGRALAGRAPSSRSRLCPRRRIWKPSLKSTIKRSDEFLFRLSLRALISAPRAAGKHVPLLIPMGS